MRKVLISIMIFAYYSNVFAEVDPLQEINEKTHNLNQNLDQAIATPIAKTYRKVTPDFVEIGITNFTDNIEDLYIPINLALISLLKLLFQTQLI